MVPPRGSAAARADRDLRRQALPVGTEIQEPHVPGVRCEQGERFRQWPEVAPGTCQRQAPVVHGDVDETIARLERQLDLAEVVVRVCVVKSEADEPFDNPAQPPRIVFGNSGSGRKRREESQY